jgi:hypothetical protein
MFLVIFVLFSFFSFSCSSLLLLLTLQASAAQQHQEHLQVHLTDTIRRAFSGTSAECKKGPNVSHVNVVIAVWGSQLAQKKTRNVFILLCLNVIYCLILYFMAFKLKIFWKKTSKKIFHVFTPFRTKFVGIWSPDCRICVQGANVGSDQSALRNVNLLLVSGSQSGCTNTFPFKAICFSVQIW